MTILQTPTFSRSVKKLLPNQKIDLDSAVRTLAADPSIGDQKKGDLAGIRVYKFHMAKQHALLAYTYQEDTLILTLLALGSHETSTGI